MVTVVKLDGLEIHIGRNVKDLGEIENSELENLYWYGITYIVTTYFGDKIFYISKENCTKKSIKNYLKSYKVDPISILEFLY